MSGSWPRTDRSGRLILKVVESTEIAALVERPMTPTADRAVGVFYFRGLCSVDWEEHVEPLRQHKFDNPTSET